MSNFTTTDKIIIKSGSTTGTKTPDELYAYFLTKGIRPETSVLTVPALLALTGVLADQSFFVQDATGDPTVTAGWALYRSTVSNPSSISQYIKIAEQEALDVQVVVDLGYTPSATDGVVTSNLGQNATLPLATASNAGLLSPADKAKSDLITATSAVNLDTVSSGSTANATAIASLYALDGVTAGAVNLGAFAGSTIAPNSTVKAALQALETATEAATHDPVSLGPNSGLALVGQQLVFDASTLPAL